MKFNLKIGPAVIQIEADDPPWQRPDPLYSLFEYDGHAPVSLLIRIRKGPFGMRENGKLIAELTNEWKLYAEEEGHRFEVIEKREFQARVFAKMSPTWDQIDFYREPPPYYPSVSKTQWGFEEVMVPLVQWWLTGWAARTGLGLIFHSAALSYGGMGLAFVAPSGGGKSTLANLCRYDPDLTLMNDERVCVWRNHGGWQLSSTPWHGLIDQVSAMTVPLRYLFLLKKGPENRVVQVSSKSIFNELVQQVFLPFWDPHKMKGLMSALDLLMKEVEIQELHFVNNSTVVDYLKAIAKESACSVGV